MFWGMVHEGVQGNVQYGGQGIGIALGVHGNGTYEGVLENGTGKC